jgi:SAM-dependent methyltransferase
MSEEMHPELTSYDEVFYPCRACHKTHPDLLATHARLFGMSPRTIHECQVLEIGCGDGTNLISLAYGLPGSRFTGIDLADRPLAQGLGLIKRLGLDNISLSRSDLMDFPMDSGSYDYIIAHGFYSWVPLSVRDRLLEICRAMLSPNGVAFISYNCYPGGHISTMLREMMLFHIHHVTDAAARIRQARAFLQFLADAPVSSDEHDKMLKKEVAQICGHSAGAFYHNDLAEVNQPVYFHEFIEHAGRYGLQYLAEAEYYMMQDASLTEETQRVLRGLEENRLLREQYLDFIRLRRFRQTLLCHQEVPIRNRPDPSVIPHLRLASPARRRDDESSAKPDAPAVFQNSSGGTIMICRDMTSKAVMEVLAEAWPRSLDFGELMGKVDPAIPAELQAEKSALVSGIILRGYGLDLVELRLHEPGFAYAAGERPNCSPLARLQLEQGEFVTNLRHVLVDIQDESIRRFIPFIDGTRDRRELAAELARINANGPSLDRILSDLCHLALLLPSKVFEQ